MPSLFKHKLNKREKFILKWTVIHLVAAVLIGIALAIWLVDRQGQADQNRVETLAQNANATVAQPADADLPPNTPKLGGPFTLTDQEGKVATEKDFAGKYLLVYFGYTYCPDMCPTGLTSMSRALDTLGGDADKVAPLFITVDPARDTAKRLKEYDSSFSPRIVGLTGTTEQIASVTKEYQVFYLKGEGDQDYDVQHTSLIYLLSPQGDLITTFNEEVDPKVIVTALHKAWGQSDVPVTTPAASP